MCRVVRNLGRDFFLCSEILFGVHRRFTTNTPAPYLLPRTVRPQRRRQGPGGSLGCNHPPTGPGRGSNSQLGAILQPFLGLGPFPLDLADFGSCFGLVGASKAPSPSCPRRVRVQGSGGGAARGRSPGGLGPGLVPPLPGPPGPRRVPRPLPRPLRRPRGVAHPSGQPLGSID